MIKRLLVMGAAALAALAGGCGDGPSTVAGGYRSAAAWSSFVHATASGPLLLDVHGDPFGVGAGEVARTVAEAMSGAIPARPHVMTIRRDEAPRPAFRVVVMLGAPAGLDVGDLCAGRIPDAAGGTGGRIDLMAAFCDGETPLSSVRGWVARVDGPGDRRFRLLLAQAMRELMGEPV